MFVNVNLGADVQEAVPAPEGRYLLRVVNVQSKESRNTGAPMIQVMHEIDGHPQYAPVFQYLVLPKEDDEEKSINFKLLQIKRYLNMAGIPFGADGFNQEDLMGAELEANLTFDAGDGERPPSNQIQMDRLPRESE